MSKTYEDIKPLKKRDKWHKGFLSPYIFYPPVLQIDSFNVYFGFDRPIDRVKILRIVNKTAVIDIATGLLIPNCNLVWHFGTLDKSDTYNPFGIRLLNGGISGKLDNFMLLGDTATDLNTEIDVYSDSSNNFFFLHCYSYLPISYVGLRIEGYFNLLFEYQ